MSDNHLLLKLYSALQLAYPLIKANSMESGEKYDLYIHQEAHNALAEMDGRGEPYEIVKVGIPEIRKYMQTCEDPMTKLIYRRWEEARRKNSMWCSRVAKLEEEVARLKGWLAPQEE